MKSSGDKPLLVLLHAFPLSAAMWEPNRRALEFQFRLLTPDLPGFGRKRRRRAASIGAMARSVAAEIRKTGEKGPVLIGGLSMGGYVALEFARLFPKRVRALVLVSTRASSDTAEQKKKRYEQIRAVRRAGVRPLAKAMLSKLLGATSLRSRPSVVRSVRRLLADASPAGVTGALSAMARRRDNSQTLSGIKVPVLIVAGREDAVIPADETRRMRAASRRTTLRWIPRAGHLLNLECPDSFIRSLSKFSSLE